ncbi:hypothetical protein K438DRAFT_1946336 [Mycena galopus ATCC 62051]|nr:hypothetical protein K438DRAFT_1946336 [Mycena galopus ATCC 62051]
MCPGLCANGCLNVASPVSHLRIAMALGHSGFLLSTLENLAALTTCRLRHVSVTAITVGIKLGTPLVSLTPRRQLDGALVDSNLGCSGARAFASPLASSTPHGSAHTKTRSWAANIACLGLRTPVLGFRRDAHAPLYATALSLGVLILRVESVAFTRWRTLRRVELFPANETTENTNTILIPGYIGAIAQPSDLEPSLQLYRPDVPSDTRFTVTRINGSSASDPDLVGLEVVLDLECTIVGEWKLLDTDQKKFAKELESSVQVRKRKGSPPLASGQQPTKKNQGVE